MFFKIHLKNLSNIICISTKHRIKSELIGNTGTCPAQEGPASPSRARLCVHTVFGTGHDTDVPWQLSEPGRAVKGAFVCCWVVWFFGLGSC